MCNESGLFLAAFPRGVSYDFSAALILTGCSLCTERTSRSHGTAESYSSDFETVVRNSRAFAVHTSFLFLQRHDSLMAETKGFSYSSTMIPQQAGFHTSASLGSHRVIRAEFLTTKMALHHAVLRYLCKVSCSAWVSIKSKHQLTLKNVEEAVCPALSNI